MNQEMCKVFQRGGKTKDWASDARRAAKMVFYPLENAGAVEQTFALLLLSGQYFGSLAAMSMSPA